MTHSPSAFPNRSIALLVLWPTLLAMHCAVFVSTAIAEQIPPSVVEDIKREMALPQTGPLGRPLPLAGSWNAGQADWEKGNRAGFHPGYQITLLEKGHHILPWFHLNLTNQLDSSYYQEPLAQIASHGLPFAIITANMEKPLAGAEYKGKPLAERPNFTALDGTVENKASAFGPIEPWQEVGAMWAATDQIQAMQAIYPEPPAVFFVTNNEHPKMRWYEADQEIRYDAIYRDTYDDVPRSLRHGLRESIGQKWQALYQAMFSSFRRGLASASWQKNLTFGGYAAFGLIDYARWWEWYMYSLNSDAVISYWPRVWEGASAPFYVHDWVSTMTDFRVRSPQVEAMNWVFMLDEALAYNSSFVFELSIWDGHQEDNPETDKRAKYERLGQTFTPERYSGMVKFGMWLLRPRLVREFRNYTDTVSHSGEYFDVILEAVDDVYRNETLQRFWRKGELVANAAEEHPYQLMELPHYEKENRWFLLESDANPARPWTEKTEIKVFALALRLADGGKTEWLVYAHSPLGDIPGVQLNVPGHGGIKIDSTVGGSFYVVFGDGTLEKLPTGGLHAPKNLRISAE